MSLVERQQDDYAVFCPAVAIEHLENRFGCTFDVCVPDFGTVSCDLKGKTAWISCCTDQLAAAMKHYLACKARAPASTAAYILTPVAVADTDWGPLLKGMKCVALFAKGSQLHSAAASLPESFAIWHDAKQPQLNATATQSDSEQPAKPAGPLHMQFSARISGMQGRALLDTGAAETYLSQDFALKHNIKFVPAPGYTAATSANGSAVTHFGVAAVNVQLQSLQCKVRCWVAELGPNWDLIIGEPWLSEHKAVLSYDKLDVVVQKSGHLITLKCGTAGGLDPGLAADTNVDAIAGNVPILSALQMNKTMNKPGHQYFLLSVSAPEGSDAEEARSGAEAPELLKPVLDEFSDVFKDTFGLPPERNVVHPVELLPGSKPVHCYPRRMSPAERRCIEETVKDLLARGLIESSSSPWASAVVFAAKPDGSLRVCVDYRRLNALSKKQRMPLPNINNLYDMLQGARYFTNLDLTSGYHQIRIAPDHCEKTASLRLWACFSTECCHLGFAMPQVPFRLL